MSHYPVCVVIPGHTNNAPCTQFMIEESLASVLAPYKECPEGDEYLVFEDKTEEAKEKFKTATVAVVQYPGGSLKSPYGTEFRRKFILKDGKIYSKDPNGRFNIKVETEESRALVYIPDYPAQKWYSSFEDFCEDYYSYTQNDEGQWGETYNPNAKWDWYSIGGRFHGPFLVKKDLSDCLNLSKEAEDNAPDGYKYVNAARKKDICWEQMKEAAEEGAKSRYELLKTAYDTRDTSKLGVLEGFTDEGVVGWGTVEYMKDESLEDYLMRKGVTSRDKYQIDTYSFIDATGNWFSHGDMGWFGISSNEKAERTWKDELLKLMEATSDNDYLVVVDCHI